MTDSDVKTIVLGLRASRLFDVVELSSFREGYLARFSRSDIITEEYGGADCVGVILSGSVTVEAGDNSSVSVLKRGGEFGICNVFAKDRMPTRLKARTDVSVLFIPKTEFSRLLASDNALMYRYVRLCNEKMIYLAKRLRILMTEDCTERVMTYLQTEAVNGEVLVKSSRDELARTIGISRSSFFRAIAKLSESGRVNVFPGGYIVNDPPKNN